MEFPHVLRSVNQELEGAIFVPKADAFDERSGIYNCHCLLREILCITVNLIYFFLATD
jgi:hypothetical protein